VHEMSVKCLRHFGRHFDPSISLLKDVARLNFRRKGVAKTLLLHRLDLLLNSWLQYCICLLHLRLLMSVSCMFVVDASLASDYHLSLRYHSIFRASIPVRNTNTSTALKQTGA